MPAQLVGIHDGIRILLDKPIMLLGRDAECDIQFDSRKISRRHCCLAQVGERFIIRDLGSTNGVRINGVRVAEGYLKSGDELAVGNLRYRIVWADAAVEAGAPGPNKTANRAVTPPPKAAAVDDDLLESCDEPVALSEPGAPGPQDGQTVRPHPAIQSPVPRVIPDDLELASSSGANHRSSTPSPKSSR